MVWPTTTREQPHDGDLALEPAVSGLSFAPEDDNDDDEYNDDDNGFGGRKPPSNRHHHQTKNGNNASSVWNDDSEQLHQVAHEFEDVSEASFQNAKVSTLRMALDKAEGEAVKACFPDGFNKHLIPLVLSIVALAFNAAGSWDCSYFSGANIRFTGHYFGLWTLEDSNGKCQLWDVIFFAYDLGGPLISARVFSMMAMLIGLGLTATMAQASQFHLASWSIGLALFVVFVVSVSTTDIFNVWAVFWLWTYCIMVLIVRFLFIHPVARRISQRGTRIIAGFFVWCGICCLLTMVVLMSDYCTCDGITAEKLEGRDPGDPCSNTCRLGPAAYYTIVASVFYFGSAAACLWFGVQPDVLRENKRRPKEHYRHYPQTSIVTRIKYITGLEGSSAAQTTSNTSSRSDTEENLSAANADYVSTLDPRQKSVLERKSTLVEKEEAVSSPGLEPIGEHKSHRYDSRVLERSTQFGQEPAEQPNNNSNDNDADDDGDDELDWDEDTRNWCSRCCCDYRVKPRSTKEKIFFWSFRTMLGLGLVIYGLLMYMLIGSRNENTKSAKLPSTTKYFTTPQVCAFNPQNASEPFRTFESKDEAVLANWTIAHCGNCGYCSNPHDIITYVETRKTIAKSSKKCGVNVYLGTYEDLADCLQDRIGFTRQCTECWADNMVTTGEKCLSTCLRTLFSGFMTDNNVPGAGDQGWLNQCLFCDEKNSGPSFVTCSGVARRRLGIVSEIERNPEEQCSRVEIDWTTVNFTTSIGFEKKDESEL